MAKDNFWSNMIDFIKKSKINFSNGLSHTDNDAMIGQAANMQNMIIENGIAVKRNGSICLNKCDEVQDYYLLETITVAGSEFIIAVNSSRNLIAFFKDFPEKPMYVCRSHFSRTNFVSFTRGVRFFKISTPFGWTILNEFGDAYTIKSDGILKVGVNSNFPAYYPLSEIDRDDDNKYLLYLDVFDATNTEIETFFMENDGVEDTIPIKGDVRVATINEAGVISKLSPAINIAEKECKLFGLNPFSEYKVTIKEIADNYRLHRVFTYSFEDSYFHSSYRQRIQLEEERTLSDVYNKNFNSKQLGTSVSDFLVPSNTIRCIVSKVSPDFYGDTGTDDAHVSDACFLIPINTGDQDPAVQMTTIATATGLTDLHGRYKMQKVGRLLYEDEYVSPPADTTPYVEATDAYISGDANAEDKRHVGSETFIAFITHYKEMQLHDNSLQWSTLLGGFQIITDVGETACRYYYIINGSEVTEDGSHTASSAYFNDGDLVDISYSISTNKLTKAFPTLGMFDKKGDDKVIALEHKGFDCWENHINGIISGISVYFDTTVYDFYELGFSWFKSTLLNKGSIFLDDAFTDKQFAVWSDNFIISKSQRVFTDSSGKIIYGIEDEQLSSNYLNYDGTIIGRNVSNAKGSLPEKFLAVTKPVYQTLRRQAHIHNPFTEILKDVDDIASNEGILCAIRSNRLWFGSSITLLLDKQQAMNGKLYAVNSLGEYFVVFTSEGSFVMSPDGKKQSVYNSSATNPSIIKSHTGLKAVYGINMLGEIIMLTQREISKNQFAFVVDVISTNIHSVQFSSQTIIKEIADVLYVADGDTIYAYKNGIWSEKMFFDGKTVRQMTNLDDKLVVFFNDNFDVEDADISKGLAGTS